MSEGDWGRTVSGGEASRWDRVKDVMLGGPRRLGWWTVPLFVAVGLLGAVLAGSLAAVYYAQQVEGLRSETEAARNDLNDAVEQVSEAADQALTDIESEVAAVRDELAVTPPFEDAAAAGIASVRAEVVIRPAQEPSPPPPGPGASEQPPQRQPAQTATRSGSAFAVVAGEGQTFFVTAFAVVADPQRPGFPVGQAEVSYAGNTVAAEVHSWDAARDLALLRVPGLAQVGIAEWRPDEERVTVGDRLFAVGLTPTGALSQFGTSVGGVDTDALLLDTALPDVVRGGPIVDGGGRIVAIASTAYQPYGAGGAANPAVPIRVLCESLVRCGAGDVGEGGAG